VDKARISITVDSAVLSEIDQAAAAAGLSRSAWVEKISHEAHLREWIGRYRPPGGTEELPADQVERLRAVRGRWADEDAR